MAVLIRGTIGDRTLAYSGAKVPSRFYPGDLVIREIWLLRETGRFVMYPRDSRIIRENWHVCISDIKETRERQAIVQSDPLGFNS